MQRSIVNSLFLRLLFEFCFIIVVLQTCCQNEVVSHSEKCLQKNVYITQRALHSRHCAVLTEVDTSYLLAVMTPYWYKSAI